MKKLSLFFAIPIFAGLIVELGLALRRFPWLAVILALAPVIVTWLGVAWMVLAALWETR